jgi:hypothetical protein
VAGSCKYGDEPAGSSAMELVAPMNTVSLIRFCVKSV